MSQELNNNVETATPLSYLQLISQDEKAVKAEKRVITAQESALELNRAIFTLNSDISKLTRQINTAKRQIPYSVSTEYALAQKLKEAQTKLDFAQAIKAERFADAQI